MACGASCHLVLLVEHGIINLSFSSYLIESLNTLMSSLSTQHLAGLILAFFVTVLKIEYIGIMPTPGVKSPRSYRTMDTSR